VSEAVGTAGKRHVRAVRFTSSGGNTEQIDCDHLVIAAGYTPAYQLPLHAGARLGYDDRSKQFALHNLPDALHVAGSTAGFFDLKAVLRSGEAAGDFSFDAAKVKIAGGSGEVMGAPFQFSGSVNWESDAKPSVVDLALKTNEVAWIDDQTINADAAIDCRVEGPVDALAVSGTVTMAEGAKFWRRLVAVDTARVGDSLPLRAGMLLPPAVFGPNGWMGDRRIDLRVTAAKPLLVEVEGFSGEFVPDIQFVGTGREPQVMNGELRLVKTALTIDRATSERWDVDSAVFSFAGGPAFELDPSVALLATRKAGRSKQTIRLSGSAAAASGVDDTSVSVRLR